MLSINLLQNGKPPAKILCLGAHSDDIEIGCGGTILQLLSCSPDVEVSWVVLSSGTDREHEARNSANLFLEQARQKEGIVKEFRDGFFPCEGAKIKEYFEELKKQVSPDLIFTP